MGKYPGSMDFGEVTLHSPPSLLGCRELQVFVSDLILESTSLKFVERE